MGYFSTEKLQTVADNYTLPAQWIILALSRGESPILKECSIETVNIAL